jgi:hypothetical protein
VLLFSPYFFDFSIKLCLLIALASEPALIKIGYYLADDPLNRLARFPDANKVNPAKGCVANAGYFQA